MNNYYWKLLRIFLLAVTFGSICAVLGKSLLYPSSPQATTTSFTFPENIPLASWQLFESTPLEDNKKANLISARLYEYQQNNLLLQVEMRYLIKTSGNVKTMAEQYRNQEISLSTLTIHHEKGVGFYGLTATSDRAYLSSCINPYGGSTVTGEQFRDNRNTHDLRATRLVPWLLGQQELRDFRCLWSILSIPLEKNSPAEAYPLLEKAWFEWYAWWQPRFPKP